MIDRQDIDALLISALYGELTPADEARLQTHLESHPADKTALADLTLARTAVRESRFLTVQLEPPQAVSALLLQEASRRSRPVPIPREKSENWFARFVASFARHPAMAAAAMMVLVIGVAGAMYMRNGVQSAERTTETFGAPVAQGSAQLAAPADHGEGDAQQLQRNAGSAFEADLAEPNRAIADAGVATGVDDVNTKGGEAKLDASKDKKAATRTYIQTETKPELRPMELEDRRQDKAAVKKPDVSKNESLDEDGYRVSRKPTGGAGGTTGAARPTTTVPGVVAPRNDPAPAPAAPSPSRRP